MDPTREMRPRMSRTEGSDQIAKIKRLHRLAAESYPPLQEALKSEPYCNWNFQLTFNHVEGKLKTIEVSKLRSLNEY
jgi:hypothetical protein